MASSDSITPLASLSLTHVYYVRSFPSPFPPSPFPFAAFKLTLSLPPFLQNPTDHLSHLGAFLALVPQALIIVYATLLWSTREAEVLLMFLGQLACEAVNFVLKRLIKEERPKHILAHTTKGYGMPSSHAQFVAFWAVALGLFLCVRHKPPVHKGHPGLVNKGEEEGAKEKAEVKLVDVPKVYKEEGFEGVRNHIEAYSHTPWTLAQRVFVSAGAAVIAALVSWSRVYLGYHTVKQVFAGSAAGVVSGAAWFAVTYLMRKTGMLAWLLELPVARWLRIRDLVVEEDLCQAGWEKWEERRVKRTSKKKT